MSVGRLDYHLQPLRSATPGTNTEAGGGGSVVGGSEMYSEVGNAGQQPSMYVTPIMARSVMSDSGPCPTCPICQRRKKK